MATIVTLGCTLAFNLLPDLGATAVLAYLAYAAGAGIEFFALRRDGPFVRSGSTAIRKEVAFLMLLAVIFAIPILVSTATSLPALYDGLRSAMRGRFAFGSSLLICGVTAYQAHALYQ